MQSLIDFISQILQWLLEFVDWCIVECLKVIGTACVAVVAAIPVPSFFTNASTSLSSLPSGVLYFAQSIDLSTGIATLISAVILRFLIRRIPFIG